MTPVPVHLKDVTLTTGVHRDPFSGEESVAFYCNPLMDGITAPSSVTMEIEWFVDDVPAYQQEFPLNQQTSASLPQKHFRMGQTLRCTATAKHSILGTR